MGEGTVGSRRDHGKLAPDELSSSRKGGQKRGRKDRRGPEPLPIPSAQRLGPTGETIYHAPIGVSSLLGPMH